MKPPSHPAADTRPGAILLAAVLCGIALAGCIIIPVDYHATGSRHNITMEATNVLRVGVTTRAEVLLALGEPDFVSEDGQRFGYLWTKVKAIWAVASYGPGAGGEVTRSYLVETTFDGSNRVSDVRWRQKWGESVTGTPDTDGTR
jgi:outer membrane protein assembly factor BamE (lipoprotein component of BamABCDE complex)